MGGGHPLPPPDPQQSSEAIQTFKATDSAAFSEVFCLCVSAILSQPQTQRRTCMSVLQVSPKQALFLTKGAFSCRLFFFFF